MTAVNRRASIPYTVLSIRPDDVRRQLRMVEQVLEEIAANAKHIVARARRHRYVLGDLAEPRALRRGQVRG
jgi:hypothetical protein